MPSPTTIAFTLVFSIGLLGEDDRPQWSQFRGPAGRGVAADGIAPPAVLDPEENLLWKTPLAPGHSSPALWGERVFLTGHGGDSLTTFCLDRSTGEVLWTREVEPRGAERLHPTNDATAPTPACDAERVVVYFGTYGLLAYDHAGELLWERPLPVPQNTFGSAASPILAEGLVVFVHDSNVESYLEAIDAESGETVWRTERGGFGSGWSTPTLHRRGEVDEVIVLGVWWMTGYDLADGKELWSAPGLTDEPIVTPATGEGLVFVSSYNMKTNPEVIGLPPFAELLAEHDADGNGLLDLEEARTNESILSRYDADGEGDHPLEIFFGFLDEDGSGDLTEAEYQKMFTWLGGFEHANAVMAIRPGGGERETEVVWQESRGVPECPSPLYYEGRVYLVKNGGIASCLNATTGELLYQERSGARGPVYASPVAGGGRVYTASARGVVTVLAAGDSFEVLSRNDLGERIMATPALADGRIYVRTEGHLLAFGSSARDG